MGLCGWEIGSSPGGDALRHAGGRSPQRGHVARLVRELHGLDHFGPEQTIRLPIQDGKNFMFRLI